MHTDQPIPNIESAFGRHPSTLRNRFPTAGIIEYFGTVNYATNERVLAAIKSRLAARESDINLIVTSGGGPTGTAMSFYDTVRRVLRADITTIGSGDVDSSGILIFLSGNRRYVTPNTTLLLHLAGRVFDGTRRYTAADLESMAKEDRLKDRQYASVVAEHSGELTTAQVLNLMSRNTVLSPADLVKFGLADAILE